MWNERGAGFWVSEQVNCAPWQPGDLFGHLEPCIPYLIPYLNFLRMYKEFQGIRVICRSGF